MSVQIDFNAFKKTPLHLGDDARYLSHGGQAVVLHDRGTVVKLYYCHMRQDGAGGLENAIRERELLSWFNKLGMQGVSVPKPIDLVQLADPVPFKFLPWGEFKGDDFKFSAALRMSLLPGQRPDFPLSWLETHQEQGRQYFKNQGRVMGQFHLATEGQAAPDVAQVIPTGIEAGALYRALSRPVSEHISHEQLRALTQIHEQVLQRHPADRIIHGDFHAGNTIIEPVRGAISGVVDFANTKYGRPEHDLMISNGNLGQPAYAERWKAIEQGYIEATGYRPCQVQLAVYRLIDTASKATEDIERGDMSQRFTKYNLPAYLDACARYQQIMGVTLPDQAKPCKTKGPGVSPAP